MCIRDRSSGVQGPALWQLKRFFSRAWHGSCDFASCSDWFISFFVFCRDWPAVYTLVLVWWQSIGIALYIRLQLTYSEWQAEYIFPLKTAESEYNNCNTSKQRTTTDKRQKTIGLMRKTNFMGHDSPPCVSVPAFFPDVQLLNEYVHLN